MTEMGPLASQPDFRRGFAALAERGLSYDLNIRWRDVPHAVALARAFPAATILIDNMGNPAGLGASELEAWIPAMRRLAALPNVAMKISGLGMADHRWTVASVRPWVTAAIDLFSPDRCMFGSNWPVDSLYGSFPTLVAAFRELTVGLSAAERETIFSGTAARCYRI
jgi:predicted TIM-barrel fold metal-dependent hydrolase